MDAASAKIGLALKFLLQAMKLWFSGTVGGHPCEIVFRVLRLKNVARRLHLLDLFGVLSDGGAL